MVKNMNISLHFSKYKFGIVKVLLSAVFIVLVLVPLFKMFTSIKAIHFKEVFSSPSFVSIVTNSLTTTIIATLITILLAYIIALCIERSNIKYKSIFGIFFIIPMLIPSISNGMGLIILFGNNGLLTNLFGFESFIYGPAGIVIGSVLYSFPVAFLMISDVMKYEDYSPYEAATVLGIDKKHQFSSISLPYLRKPLISVVFSVFTMIITDYGVPLMVGGKFTTISAVMYQEVIGQLNFGKGSVYGCILLIPAVAAFILDITNKDRGNSSYASRKFKLNNSFKSKTLSYILCSIVAVFLSLPLLSFVILGFTADYPNDLSLTFDNIVKTFDLNIGKYLSNSILISLFVSVIGVAIAFLTAYFSSRVKSKTSKFLHLAAITSAAIPGVVLGLSYVLVFKGSFIYGTIAILVMVNIMHFIASPYLMMYNSFSKLNCII